MNKALQILIFMFWSTLSYSQNIIVDGVTFSADGKTLIEYPKDKTDEKYVVPEGTQIIETKAFEQVGFLSHIVLPFSLKEIKDNAFFECSDLNAVTWSKFPPIVGRDIFQDSPIREFYVSDGADCVVVNNVLFSTDQKKLLRYPPFRKKSQDEPRDPTYSTDYVIPEGTEVINKLAFDRANLYDVTLPSTLKTIEEGAFWVEPRVPVGRSSQVTTRYSDFEWDMEYRNMDMVSCYAIVPPVLIGNPFVGTHWVNLYVPEESFDTYCYAPGWTEFRNINGKLNLASVNNTSWSGLKVFWKGDNLSITGTKNISEIRLYTLSGTLLLNKTVNDYLCNLPINNPLHRFLLLEIVYKDGMKEKVKLHK